MLQAELHAERNIVLKLFHTLLRNKVKRDGCTFNQARGYGYAWLAGQMKLEPKRCNISVFNIDECYKAKAILSKYVKPAPVRGTLL